IPFQDAAEIGTRKVIAEHSTLGVVVLTDGSITDIPRSSYLNAEERVVWELKELGKPYVIVLNSLHPDLEETVELVRDLEDKYDVPVLALNAAEMNQEDILSILQEALYEFPVEEVSANLPLWIEELDPGHWLRADLDQAIRDAVNSVHRLREIDQAVEQIKKDDFVATASLEDVNL